ncbi:MAG TPA: PQQ-binding-like beta-propeller repeat protein [Planctomycetaceae bacterium]|jgi:outer membrane protein assembly factor BamB|nr:PQQ-binding-like beta-propeller repeat protein [Planctomycetaceae bacterium]
MPSCDRLACAALRRGAICTLALAVACSVPISSFAQSKSAETSNSPAKNGDDWPAFLGPSGTGVTVDAGLANHWPKGGPPIVWEKHIGSGYSAPSVRWGKLVVHHRLRNESIVECMRAATGERIWKVDYESTFTDPYGYNNGPRCTPLLTDKYCYTFGAEGKLLCVELATGKHVWGRDVSKDFYVPAHFFGTGCTPIIEGDLLIVLVGGQPNSGVVAFKAATGDVVWQSVGKSTWDGDQTDWPTEAKYRWTGDEMSVSYSSPIAATIHGKRQILCLMRQGLVSVDPQNGHVNFHHWFCARDYESVNAVRPVVIGDKIFLTAAYRVGSVLLEVQPACDGVKVVWRNRTNLLAHWSTPIYRDGFLYGFSGRHEAEGELRCLEVATGKVAWSTRGFEGSTDQFSLDPRTGDLMDRATREAVPFPYFGRGSLTQAGDRFLVLGERGTLALGQLSPQGYKELSRASFKDIRYPVWPSPVLAGTKLYLRDENTLLCLELGRGK